MAGGVEEMVASPREAEGKAGVVDGEVEEMVVVG